MSAADWWFAAGLLAAVLGVLAHIREWRAEQVELRRARGGRGRL